MSRILALVGAIAMIVVAVVVRGALDDDDGADAADRDADSSTEVVVCIPELADACPEGATVEAADTTADRLIGGDDVDTWLTFDPWPAMVDDARTRAGLDPLFDEQATLASSRLAAVVLDDLADCDWRCIGEVEQVGARPLSGGLGLLHLGAVATGFNGSPDFAANDLPGEFRTFLEAFADAIEPTNQPVRRMLQTRGAEFDAALSYEAEARPQFEAAATSNRAGLALTYPAPVIYAVAVAAGDPSLLDGAADELAAAGWQPGEQASGLPAPGVMTALRGLL